MSEPERFEVGQVTGLAYGGIGTADRCRGTPVGRRILSQYRLSAQQE